jgi:trk system potassium uptake protein TrkA
LARYEVAVLGLGRFGSALAIELEKAGTKVLGVDPDAELVQSLAEDIRHLAIAEAHDVETLEQLGIGADTLCILGMTDVEASLLIMTALTALGVREVWAKSGSGQHTTALSRLGATRIMQPEREAGLAMAQEILSRA